MKKLHVVMYSTIAVTALTIARPAAQAPAPPTAAQIQARHAISALEGVLENAVQFGKQMLDQRLQESSAANMVMLAGMARARGFRLDDYGVVFDVEFPSMRRSMVWSLQQLERASTGGTGRAAPESPSIKPREIYLAEITSALTEAILDHGAPIGVAPTEWLTVAARETTDRRFVPGDPADTAMSIILRIKGTDLSGLRERTLTRDEARKRVEIRQY